MTGTIESAGKSLGVMALYVIIGIPMVAYIWDVLNELLALEFPTGRVLIAIPVAVLLVFYLRFVSRRLRIMFQQRAT
jgi:hypothetical protein